MRGIADRPAQIGQAQTAKSPQRIAGRRLGQRRLDLGPEASLRLLRHRLHQRAAAREMPERRPRRDPGAPGRLADADRLSPALSDQLQRGVDQDPPEIAMMIGLWHSSAGGSPARAGGSGLGSGWFGGTTHAPPYHHRLVNVSIDYTD